MLKTIAGATVVALFLILGTMSYYCTSTVETKGDNKLRIQVAVSEIVVKDLDIKGVKAR